MDIGLRGGMDGIEAAWELQKLFDLPVIYLSAFADEATLERAKATRPYGYAVKPFNELEIKVLIEMALVKHRADVAMHRARESERNRADPPPRPGSPTDEKRHFTARELHDALKRSEFEIYFQPIFDLQTLRVTGAEALVRWNHPEKGLIPATDFIHAAERIGIIAPIVDLSLRKACSAAKEWLASAPNIRVSVNLSDSDLQRRDVAAAVAAVLEDLSLAPEHLEVEVSEHSSAERAQSLTVGNLEGLRELGVLISLDGFGREHGSMVAIRRFPVRRVKIDRSLVNVVTDDPQVLTIVKATVDVTESFNISVVAVGVETDEQLKCLQATGCHQAQGNLLGTPMSTEDFFKEYVM
jgi:EAL domain-containing protein (putative c-di-GMP-specific phosphodiesterase class I)